jgi:hypothetical protein
MPTQPSNNLSNLLAYIAAALDIPDNLYEDAVVQYEDVGEWLASEESALARYSPGIYPQGSFRLGTVVRPVTERDYYDIDLVCQLAIEKERTTQAELKELVGTRLKERSDLRGILEECGRCWNLNYEDYFCMDVLPSLPNPERRPTGILLTDLDLVRWQKSNPIAYADWFRERMRTPFEQQRLKLAEERKADVASVPEWQIKTPLQRVVQLLKRHRNIYFVKDLEHRPASIIITTLAAQAYSDQLDLYEALWAILNSMEKFIVYRDGRYIVASPVEADENFADKWNDDSALRVAFFKWLERAKHDFLLEVRDRTAQELVQTLSPVLGSGAVQVAAAGLGIPITNGRQFPARPGVVVPDVGPAGHRKSPPWPERLVAKVRVRCGVYLKRGSKKKLWDLSTRPLPKNVSIKCVATTDAPEPFEVQWQVVNTGDEATQKGDLRGDFYTDGGATRWEVTRYSGTHWIEAFIIKSGVCIARSGKIYIKIRG